MRTADLANQLTLNFKTNPTRALTFPWAAHSAHIRNWAEIETNAGDMTKDPGADSSGTAPYDYFQTAGHRRL